MSPQSIFAFVLLSVFAISAPAHAGLIKTDLVSQLGLTAAVCTGLQYSAPGVNTLYDACVAAKLVVNTNAVTTTKSALDLSASTEVYANVFLSTMNSCNKLSLQLNAVLGGIAQLTTSTVTSLSVDVVIPTLTKVNLTLDGAAFTTAKLTTCTDAAVNASVLQSYNLFATNLLTLCSSISSSLTIHSSVEVKASLHSTLTSLRSTLVVYVARLDSYLSADLAKTSLNAKLFLSVDAALKATV